jgi:thiamine biosynthesis protein ThiS
MIRIKINRKYLSIADGMTVQELLDEQKLSSVAIWINGTQLRESEYAGTKIRDGDELKILRLIYGG